MGSHEAIEVAKTVMEVADMAWTAMECCHHHQHQKDNSKESKAGSTVSEEEELQSLQSENRRLRKVLEQNLKLLRDLSKSPCLSNSCPPDLYNRLVATVDSKNFLSQLKSLHEGSTDETRNVFPFKEATGDDLNTVEILINVDHEEPSWWVWITDELVPSNAEEWSGLDNESYVVISEEHVVDGVANFMARCVLSNPKSQNMTSEELQKTLVEALGGASKLNKLLRIWHAGKMFYTLSKWGLALTGLYRSRAVLKLAAKGVLAASKVALKGL